MKETKTTKEAGSAENALAHMSEQVLKNWEKALRSGLKLQEQASQWWGQFPDAPSVAREWQKQFTQFSAVVGTVLPQGQKQMEGALDLIVENNRKGQEIFRKALDAARTPVLADSQAKWKDLWNDSVEALRANLESVTQLQTEAVNSWVHFVQKNGEAA